jgi:hypothetical protein
LARSRKEPPDGDKPKPPRGSGKKKPPDEQGGGHGGDGDGDDQGRTPPGNPNADPVRIHREYVERHVGGGADPTPEAYARAVREWHRLPGAVTAPASELSGEDVDREADADARDEDDNQGGERAEDTER